jgi:hypothetical protein
MAFPDITSLKSSLKIAQTDANLDTLLEEWRLASISSIEEFCGQPIAARNITYGFEAIGNRHTPAYFPIRTLSNLQQFDIQSGTWSNVVGTVQLVNGSIYYAEGFTRGTPYQATLRVGYNDIPEEILGIFREMVLLSYKNSDYSSAARLGLSSVTENFAGTSKTLSLRNMMEEWHQKLDKYRVPPV